MEEESIQNGLIDLTEGLLSPRDSSFGTPVGQTLPSIINNRYNLIFNNRITLNELYIEHGLIQTLVDQPVSDAFSTGIKIITKEMSDSILEVEQYMECNHVWDKIMQTLSWSRLFGGAGLVIVAGLDPQRPFTVDQINQYTKLDFYAADLWELNKKWTVYNFDLGKLSAQYESVANNIEEIPYLFYGIPLHKSRVLEVKGKEAPSLMRPRMRGWGMCVVERFLRSFNQFLKNQNVIYELLDEVKVDVLLLDQFKAGLLTKGGTSDIQQRMQYTSMLKNYLNILVMDKEDKFDRKTINFGGLGDMITQNRQNIASDLKMPITRIFGVSSAGFNSGEDDLENYNSMIRSEIRRPSKFLILQTLKIVFKKVTGRVPGDLDIEWPPLRVLSAEQEENVKSRTFNRVLMAESTGTINMKTARECINKDNLLPVEIDATDEVFISLNSGVKPDNPDTVDKGKDIDSATQKFTR